jgi:uncharacterized protein (TIGR03084 family)
MDVITALAEQQAELAGLLAPLDEPGWQRPSACDGWSVADVVLHLAQSNELAIASIEGRYAELVERFATGLPAADSVDDFADLIVSRERGQPGPAVRDRWQASADTLRELLGASDPHQRVAWIATEMSVRTLATTRLAETWIHTGDVAVGRDAVLEPQDRLWHIARLAWRTLPYAFAQAGRDLTGPVDFQLRGPKGDPWSFVPDDEPLTTIRGEGAELCLVAARRVDPRDTTLRGEGPDADAVLELVRTYA